MLNGYEGDENVLELKGKFQVSFFSIIQIGYLLKTLGKSGVKYLIS